MKIFKLLALMMCLLTFSCTEDNCEGVECGEGTCIDGTCDCPAGLEGDTCDTLSNEKYFGSYVPGEVDCGSNGTAINTISIAAHSNGNPTEVTVTIQTAAINDSIDGTIINGLLTSEGDWGGFDTTFNGTFNSDLELESVINASGLVCSITFVR